MQYSIRHWQENWISLSLYAMGIVKDTQQAMIATTAEESSKLELVVFL